MNSLILGTTGGGKTESNKEKVCTTPHAALIIYPQAESPFLAGLKNPTYINVRSGGCPFLHISRTGNEQVDFDERRRTEQMFLGPRELDPTTSPLIFDHLEYGIEVIQEAGAPLDWLLDVYKPRTERNRWLLERCSGYGWERTAELWSMSTYQLRQETGPVLRLLSPQLRDPSIRRLCGTHDLGQIVKQGGKIHLEGGGANRWSIRFVSLFALTKVLQRAEWDTVKLLTFVDELGPFRLVNDDLMHYWLTLRKQGVDMTLCTQALSFDEDVVENLIQGANRLEAFRCGGKTAFDLARYFAGADFSATREVYRDSKQRQRRTEDGWVDYVEETPRFAGFSDSQVPEVARKLMQLPTGTRYVLEHGRAFVEKVNLPPSLPWGVSEMRAWTGRQNALRRFAS